MSQTQTIGRTATTVSTDNGDTIVTYHSTNVVRFNADTVTLRSGGWRTATTKLRMNQAANQFELGYQVRQKDFDWYVDLANGKTLEFNDTEITFSRH